MSIKSLKLQKKLKKTHIFLIGLIFVGLLLHPAVQEYHKHLISSPKGDDNPNTEDAQGSEGNWEAFSSLFFWIDGSSAGNLPPAGFSGLPSKIILLSTFRVLRC